MKYEGSRSSFSLKVKTNSCSKSQIENLFEVKITTKTCDDVKNLEIQTYSISTTHIWKPSKRRSYALRNCKFGGKPNEISLGKRFKRWMLLTIGQRIFPYWKSDCLESCSARDHSYFPQFYNKMFFCNDRKDKATKDEEFWDE